MSEKIIHLKTVPIKDIIIPPKRYPSQHVDFLMQSIESLGLLHPITLTQDLFLVAGRDRLEACKRLGWNKIAAVIIPFKGLKTELAEIDENLGKKPQTVLERAELFSRRKKIYEALYPETKHGGALAKKEGKGGKAKSMPEGKGAESASFAKSAGEITGQAERTVQEFTQIAEGIDNQVKADIKGTRLENQKTELLTLARLKVLAQRDAVKKIRTGQAATVKEATAKRINICLQCMNLLQVPLPKKDINQGFRPLVRCGEGHFEQTEKHEILKKVEWDPAKGKNCPDFIGEVFDEQQKTGPRSKHINLANVLPPTLLAGLYRFFEGPVMLYLPARPHMVEIEMHNRIREVYEQKKSIRETARVVGCHRNTVRSVIREVNGLSR